MWACFYFDWNLNRHNAYLGGNPEEASLSWQTDPSVVGFWMEPDPAAEGTPGEDDRDAAKLRQLVRLAVAEFHKDVDLEAAETLGEVYQGVVECHMESDPEAAETLGEVHQEVVEFQIEPDPAAVRTLGEDG
jgi:hypothetical protein